MRIASDLYGFEVALTGIIFIDDHPAFITKRFDLHEDHNHIHMESFLQLAGLKADGKYDLSYNQVGKIIDDHFLGPKLQKKELLKRVLFYYLIGNGDAHLGNFSGMLKTGHDLYILSPLYDALNTGVHSPDESITALPLHQNQETEFYNNNGFYGMPCFAALGEQLGLPGKMIDDVVIEIMDNERFSTMVNMISKSDLSEQAKETYLKKVNDRFEVLNRTA
jgi:serine/threonine-protein kinase HipA